MKKKLSSGVLAAIFGLVLVVMPVLAAYSADIVVIESDGNSYPMLSCNATMNVDFMAAEGYIGATGLDTRILSGLTPQPHMLADNKTMFSIPVNANSSQTLQFTTGSSNLSSYPIIPGYGGYITVADNTTIELGDNFTMEMEGCWLNTDNGTDKNLVHKQYAFRTYVSPTVSGNITSDIFVIEWVSPTNFTDASAHWANETNAYDGNTATFSQASIPVAPAWCGYLELVTTALNCNNIRYWITVEDANVDDFEVDVYYNAGWHSVVSGAPVTGAWQEATLGAYYTVTRARMRFHAAAGGAKWGRLHEFEFTDDGYDVSISATSVASGEHSWNAEASNLIFREGDVLDSDGLTATGVDFGNIYSNQDPIWMDFWFKLDTPFNNASPFTAYLFQKDGAGINDLFILLDNGNGRMWLRMSHAGAQYVSIIPTKNTWAADTWFHILFTNSIADGATLRIDDGIIYTDTSSNATPTSGDLILYSHTAIGTSRIDGEIANFRVGTDNLTMLEKLDLYHNIPAGDETDIWYFAEGTGTHIPSFGSANNTGTAGAGLTWDTDIRPCTFAISIDSTVEDSYVRPIAVPNNTANWTFMQNNVTDFFSYADNITIEIDGVQQLWFEPNAYIVGTTLPDRQGGNNPGTFSWGGNPTGVAVELGSLMSGYDPTYVSPTLTTPDVVPEIAEDPTMYITDVEVEAAIATDPIAAWWDTWVTATAVSGMGIDIKIMYWMAFIVVAVLAFAFAYKYSNNLLIAGIVAIAVLGFGVARGVFPFWLIIVLVFFLLGLVSMERRTQL